ncbi:hypothetical protein SNOG_02925 [Parastagonospora nodorum SN15]|uniref:Uncharacterized protein n=1 Tax=Phaeosphaeria nodorum (strain SN15 / ATCC MYA-4574 / FGSC 10173) TaxID=321614 RepID=Q0UZ89_PHANO|nr:hypothetical protein SNOG_02925 [Parastagonospora nodorum SN15]EAT89656.1 hypothetical protein SNOG_02925 [Parastagonospora nodorum SN15]
MAKSESQEFGVRQLNFISPYAGPPISTLLHENVDSLKCRLRER